MSQIVKVIPLLTSKTATRAVDTYGVVPNCPFIFWDSSAYGGTVEVYFEAVIKTSAGIAYAALYTNAGVYVEGSEVSTDSLTPIRLRSGNIAANLVDDTEYRVRIKNSAANTTTIYSARLIIIQSGTITKTETQIEIGNTLLSQTTAGSYVEYENCGYFLYTAANWNGTIAAYFESTFSGNQEGVDAKIRLEKLDGTPVAGSELTVNGFLYDRKRSGNIFSNLVDGTVYKVSVKSTADDYVRPRNARLIFQQTDTPTKTETHYPIVSAMHWDNTVAGVNLYGDIYWDNEEWDIPSKNVYHQVTLRVSYDYREANADLNDGTEDDDTRSTSSITKVRLRSGAITPDDNTTYDTQIRITAVSATVYLYGSSLIICAILPTPVKIQKTLKYCIKQIPVVTTQAVDNIEKTTATGHGTIVS